MQTPGEFSAASTPEAFRFDGFELRLQPLALTQNGRAVPLQLQPLKLLALLAQKNGEIVSHQEIHTHLWPARTIDYSRSVHVYIRQIRAALGDEASSPRFIESAPRQGYRFVTNVETMTTPNAAFIDAAKTFGRNKFQLAGLLGIAAIIISAFVFVQFVAPRAAEEKAIEYTAATDLYERGLYLLEQREQSATAKSLRYFEAALEAAPAFAAAHAGAGRAHIRLSDYSAAEDRAHRAIAIDDSVAEAYVVLGLGELMNGWNWHEARSHFLAALERNPDSAAAHQGVATAFFFTGAIEEGLDHMRQARALDPASTIIRADFGWFYYFAGDYWKAAEVCNEAVDLAPEILANRHCVIRSLALAGASNLAVTDIETYMRMSKATELEIAAVLAQRPGDILNAFDIWRLRHYEAAAGGFAPSSAALAFAAAAAGKIDRALTYADRAITERHPLIPFIAIDPYFTQLHDDPRYQKLLAQLSPA